MHAAWSRLEQYKQLLALEVTHTANPAQMHAALRTQLAPAGAAPGPAAPGSYQDIASRVDPAAKPSPEALAQIAAAKAQLGVT